MRPESRRRRERHDSGLALVLGLVAVALAVEPAAKVHLRSAPSEDMAAALSVSLQPEPEPEPVTWDIPIHRTAAVERWIQVYTGHQRHYFELWLERMNRYEELIRGKLRQRGMPEDLVYVALVESGFHPLALSPAHAYGMWQFLAPTAREYGLVVDRYVDERLDPVRSTEAALEYLASLYDRFGSWYLAAAAYNAGPRRIARVLRRHAGGRTGSEELFWEIAEHLPRETQQHVPRIVASAIMAKEPERFGFEVDPHPPIQFDLVFAPGGTRLEDVALGAGVPADRIRALNPHLVRDVTPPGYLYPVRIPGGTAGEVLAGLEGTIDAAVRSAVAQQ